MIQLIPIYLLFLIQSPIEKSYLLGQFDPSKDARFVPLTSSYAQGFAKKGFLRKETFEAFKKMADAAKKDGVSIFIISPTRNFEDQKRIWINKWTGKIKVEEKDLTTIPDLKERARLILLYSAMPGSSRHHWGTDVDLNSWDNSYFEKGEGLRIYEWMTTHAPAYGFCQPYTSKKDGRTGYEEEKWHWSYLPLSSLFLDAYKNQVTYSDISGFDGSEQAVPLQVIQHYVAGVACQ